MRPKKKEKKKRSSLNFGEKIRKNTENSEKYFGKFGKILWKIRKNTPENSEKYFGKFGKILPKIRIPDAKSLFPTMLSGWKTQWLPPLHAYRNILCHFYKYILRNLNKSICISQNGSVARRPPASEEGGDCCSVPNGHFFGRRAEKILWGHRDTMSSYL